MRTQRTGPRHRPVALGARLSAHPGAALFLDYGPEHSSTGDSLQALRDGRRPIRLRIRAPPTSPPMSTSPRSPMLPRDAGAAVHGPVPQGMFLTRLGLFQRTDRLARTQPPRAHPA